MVLPTDRPAVNWVTAVAGLFGSDLFASGSSSGHVQLWRLVLDGKAFSFDVGDNKEDDDVDDEINAALKRRGGSRMKLHHDSTRIERVPFGEFHLVRYVI